MRLGFAELGTLEKTHLLRELDAEQAAPCEAARFYVTKRPPNE